MTCATLSKLGSVVQLGKTTDKVQLKIITCRVYMINKLVYALVLSKFLP